LSPGAGRGWRPCFPARKAQWLRPWFTGELKVPQEKIPKTAVPRPRYEKHLMILVEKGSVVSQEVLIILAGLAHRNKKNLETSSLRKVRKLTSDRLACQ
jgi:hypothetical protein